jgi:TATA-box binding protein (TBP) (component of TFIID and TFIIIB)
MGTFADNHTFSYLLSVDEFQNSWPEIDRPSWIKITTITIVSKFLCNVDIQKFRQRMEKLGSVNLRINGSNFSGFEWKLKPTTFYNQITLGYTDRYSTKSVKVFPNGSVQVAGCSDLFDCRRVIHQLTFLLKFVLQLDNLPSDGFRVVMINTNFSLNYNINLIETVKAFGESSIFTSVTFDPDRYSAVKIKFKPASDMKQVTASIFGTGKIIVTGAETLKEIAFAYNLINQHINSHRDQIKVTRSGTIDVFDTINGYKVGDYVSKLKEQGYRPWHYTQSNTPINF